MDRHLVAVGLNDEQVAHLRLLLRRLAAVPGVQHWTWGTEDISDLVIVAVHTYAGRMARDRATSRGRRCAILGDDEALRENELRCPAPFSTATIAQLLSNAADPAVHQGQLTLNPLDDFGADSELFGSPPALSETLPHEGSGGLEELLRRDRDSGKLVPTSMRIREDTTIEEARRPSSRADARASFDPGDIDLSARSAVKSEARRDRWPLAKYLDGDLLAAPSLLALPGLPELALDPKHRLFYSPARTMQQLIEYCTQPLVVSDWRPLTSMELQARRGSQSERPYAHLVWLGTWLESSGRLAPHLSPGADFRLKVQPDIDERAPLHAAINEALVVPGRLHVIAQSSLAPINDVIDLINAYDAIGWIEALRQRPPMPPAPAKTGLLGKLGFRKR
ncbi:MAG: hypothetical protein ABI846_04160 [Rudaea sp.]